MEKYEIMEEPISAGAFGITYYAINKEEKKLCVIKKIDLEKVNLPLVKAELKMLEEIKKKGCRKDILCLKEHFINYEEQKLYIVTEAFIEGGEVMSKKDIKVKDMRKFMYNLKFQLSELDLVKILKNLADALNYLHENGLAHNDIKPENILINEKLEVQIIDFGLSCQSYCSTGGTLSYAAPEMLILLLKKKKALSPENVKKCDIFSMGLVFYELANLDYVSDIHMFSGQINDKTNLAEVLVLFYQRKMILSKYELNNDINILINKMLNIKRMERINSEDVKIDLDRIYQDIQFKMIIEKSEEMNISTPVIEDFIMDNDIGEWAKVMEEMETNK